MSIIYPFHLIEKAFDNKEELFFSHIDSLHLQIQIIGNISEMASIYGYEAMLISVFLHPLKKEIHLNEYDAFLGWKTMNKIWRFYNNVDFNYLPEIDLYIIKGYEAFLKQKMHLYVAMINHILKNKTSSALQKNIVYRYLSLLLCF